MEAQTTLRNLPIAVEDQQIVRIGINFDSKTRNIDKVLVGRKSPHIHDIDICLFICLHAGGLERV